MKKHFLLPLFLAVLCMGCSGLTIELPGQPPVVPPEEEIVVPVPEPEQSSREVLFFTMKGCRPCEEAKPRVEAMRQQGLKVTEVDSLENPGLVRQYRVTKVPTFIVLEDGVEIERTSSISALILILVKILSIVLPLLLG